MGEKPGKFRAGFTSPLMHTNRIVTKDIAINGVVPRGIEEQVEAKKTLFVLLENFSLASFTGALDVLVTANLLTRSPVFEIQTASMDGHHIVSDLGIEITVNTAVDSVLSRDVDMLIICGGFRTPMISLPSLNRLISACNKKDAWIGGLWNGAYFMAAAGLLGLHQGAIHPECREILKEHFPLTRLSKASHVVDESYFSCAGSHGAISVMLEVLEKLLGSNMKKGVSSILLTESHRPINSVITNSVAMFSDKLMSIIDLMENNLEEPLEIAEISQYTALSKRQVERLFLRYFLTTPSRFYLELRLNRARQLLMQTNYKVCEVAMACGFKCSAHFSRSFKLVYGSSPAVFRVRS